MGDIQDEASKVTETTVLSDIQTPFALYLQPGTLLKSEYS